MERAALVPKGEYILASKSHFVALRCLDGEWQINFGHRRHTWEMAVVNDGCASTALEAYAWDGERQTWCVHTKFLDAVFTLNLREAQF